MPPTSRAHDVQLHRGLLEDEAGRRAARHGPNELAAGARRSPWRLLLEQFTDFMILVLLGAAVLSGVIGELADTLAILVIVVLNGVVGYVPWLRPFFRTQALGGGELAICLAAALAVFLAVEAEKAGRRRWAPPMAGRARTGMPGA